MKSTLLFIALWFPLSLFAAPGLTFFDGVTAVNPLNLGTGGIGIANTGCVNIKDASGTSIGVMCLPATDILTFDDTTNLEGFLFDSNGIFKLNDTLHILEQASKDTSVAGYGQIFVKTASPNTLHFVDDTGSEIELGATGGVLVNDLSPQLGGFLDMNQEDIIKTAQTRTLAMTDGVVTGIFPAVEAGVPDDWRFNSAASWFTETRNTGVYLGEHANVATAEAVSGAAIGDYYYNTTTKTYENLDDLAGADTEIFRAGSAEFPARIVFRLNETSNIGVILDAKDGSMWMVFSASDTDNFLRGVDSASKFDYRNGRLVFGVSANLGVTAISFIEDNARRWNSTATFTYIDRTVSQRNLTTSAFGSGIDTDNSILSSTVKAIAIGDASKDYGFDEWGVPRQYIAVGTDSTNGVSVIHPNGKVYDIGGQSSAVQTVNFNDFNEVIASYVNVGELGIWDIPFRDVAHTDKIKRMLNTGVTPSGENAPILKHVASDVAIIKILHDKMIAIALGTTYVTVVDFDKYSAIGTDDYQDSLPTYIGYDSVLTEHWISPLIDRLVTASLGTEIGTGDLVESNLITGNDSDFDTGIGNWTKSADSTLTVDTNRGKLTVDVNGSQFMNLSKTTVIGRAYLTRFTYVTDAITGDIIFQIGTASNGAQNESLTVSTAGTYFLPFIATATTTHISIKTDAGAQAAESIIVDDFLMDLAVQDRSQLNTNHAKINGTITRAAYDSGDVVMHSGAIDTAGINTGAYWEIGRDVFATDGVLFAGWIDWASTGNVAIMSNRALDGSGNPVVWALDTALIGSAINIQDSANTIDFVDQTGAARITTALSTALSVGLHHIVIILSSTDFYVYIDGKLDKVTASVTLTTPTDAITYIHPDGMALPRVGGIDRKSTADYYRWVYAKERRLFDNGAKASLQGTGNVVDIAVDPIRNEYTVLQTDHRTTFDMDGIVASDAAVSNTGVSVSTYDGDISILDGANLTLTTRARSVSNNLVRTDRVREKRTIEFDSLVEADARIFGTSFADPPTTGGDTVGGALLDWAGDEAGASTRVDGIALAYDDQAGDYLLTLTVTNRSVGGIKFQISGITGTARSTNATFTETLTYDPAANTSANYQFTPVSSFDGQVSDYRIRPVGIPFWLDNGWRPETVYLDGTKSRPDTPDLVRGYAVTRRFDGAYGVKATDDTWDTISLEVIEQ